MEEVEKKYENSENFTCNLSYKLYPTYNTKISSEHYKGRILKNTGNYYIKINNTIFFSDLKDKLSIKLNKDEKAMIITNSHNRVNQAQSSPLSIVNTLSKIFKTKKLEDTGKEWLCTFTTDVITQLPYGKVELFINKKDYSIIKQVLYLLSQQPYTNDKGVQTNESPRLEILISDYHNSIYKDDQFLTKLSTYIIKSGNSISPVGEYQDYKLLVK